MPVTTTKFSPSNVNYDQPDQPLLASAKIEHLLRRARSRRGRMTAADGGYVSSHIELTPEIWKRIETLSETLLRNCSDGENYKSRIYRVMFLFCHVACLIDLRQYRDEQSIPMAKTWLKKYFKLTVKDLLFEGGPLTLRKRGVKSMGCSSIWVTTEFERMVRDCAGKSSVTTLWKWLKRENGFDCKIFPFKPERSYTLKELLRKECFISEVIDLDRQGIKQYIGLEREERDIKTYIVKEGDIETDTDTDPHPISNSHEEEEIDTSLSGPVSVEYRCRPLNLIDLQAEKFEGILDSFTPDFHAADTLLNTQYMDSLSLSQYAASVNRMRSSCKRGVYTPKYKPFSHHGRYFETHGGFQGCKREIKQVLVQRQLDGGTLFNYDIKGCQAKGLQLILNHFGMSCEPITKILGDLEQTSLELGVPKDLLKTSIYAQVWGGSLEYSKRYTGELTAVGEAFTEEFGDTEVAKHRLSLVRSHLASLSKQIRALYVKIGFDVGAFLTELEQAYVHTLVVLCMYNGISVVSLQHDGVMTNAAIPEEIMHLSAKISGFTNATLIEKAFA